MANDKLMLFERSFVLSEDIPGEYTRYTFIVLQQEMHFQLIPEETLVQDVLHFRASPFCDPLQTLLHI